jgi:hypothetical protein
MRPSIESVIGKAITQRDMLEDGPAASAHEPTRRDLRSFQRRSAALACAIAAPAAGASVIGHLLVSSNLERTVPVRVMISSVNEYGVRGSRQDCVTRFRSSAYLARRSLSEATRRNRPTGARPLGSRFVHVRLVLRAGAGAN